MTDGLPPGVSVFERGWLSANNILFQGEDSTALVDSGYWTHAQQTVGLVRGALGARSLDCLLNTHLHGDHCGGNAALQAAFPDMQISIPPGQAAAVREWDDEALGYTAVGQACSRFRIDGVILPSTQVTLADLPWQIHAAPGHDPHSVVLFEPASRVLISADAFWENGFGVVFPELEGVSAFDEVAATLDLIEALDPYLIIPGHGPVFGSRPGTVAAALTRARSRLSSFQADPARHARHAAKVLVKFKLLERQRMARTELDSWALTTPYLTLVAARYFGDCEPTAWLAELVQDLVRSRAATLSGDFVLNA